MTDVSATGGMPPPGWYDDPGGSGRMRWWGGLAWTEHLQDAPVAVAVAVAAPVAVAKAPLLDFTPYVDTSRSPARFEPEAPDSANTVPVWILAIYPVIGVLFNVVVLFNLERLEVAALTGVAVVLTLFLLAVWDRAALSRLHIGGPTLWWFLLFFPLSYLIARWVKLARRGLPGAAPTVTYFVSSVIAGGLAVVIAGTVGLPAIGSVMVHQLEQQLTVQLEDATQAPWVVDCPDDARVWEAGTTFECTLTGQPPASITGHVVSPFEYEFEEAAPAATS